MRVEELEISKTAIKFLHDSGFVTLYPPQEKCIKAGLLDGKSILVSAPTASGKTLIAILATIKHLSEKKGKILYLSPLKALASEKFSEFKKLEKIDFDKKIRIKISTGDYDQKDNDLGQNDILILTNEKMDSVIRQGADWLNEISLVVVDEVHLLGDDDRGPTLEIILTKLKLLPQKPQILALSATVTNADEISKWLECKLVESNWRPVPLWEGVYDQGVVTMQDRNFEIQTSIRGAPVDLGLDSLKNGGQAILFAETRARSVSLATKASDAVAKDLNEKDKKTLEQISTKILDQNEHTELIRNLATLVKKGVAFHHAGLNQNCRSIIESEFRSGKIKLLASTPTLAAGVNLPARRVVIANINRYDGKFGANKPISVLEYKQLSGRAGRPQYDKYGEAIIVGSSNSDEIFDYYINGIPEPVSSKLTGDKALRIHVLSLISTVPGIQSDEIVDFFSKTLSGSQEKRPIIKFKIQIAIRYLESEDLIKQKGGRFIATEFGKKTSTLYIDPLTAVYFRKAIQKISPKNHHTFGILYTITSCEDFFPKFSLRNKDYELTSNLLENFASQLIENISEYDCNRSLLAMHSWINESTEIFLSDNLGIESGDMYRMAENADWLIHGFYELAKLEKRDDILEELDILRTRIEYGIKDELVNLVKVRGIGRIRARLLFKNGIKTLEQLEEIPVEKLAKVDKIGPVIAENIKTQLKKVR